MCGLHVINRATVTLLPKKPGAVDIRDFRPVSMNHGAIKIFDKILAMRLADDLPHLIRNHQSAFVRGRTLHDNFMLVQGTARRLHALRAPTVLLKLDISKAFDTVKWSFLLEVLHRMGFGAKWMSCIVGLLSTSTMRNMVNGVPRARSSTAAACAKGTRYLQSCSSYAWSRFIDCSGRLQW